MKKREDLTNQWYSCKYIVFFLRMPYVQNMASHGSCLLIVRRGVEDLAGACLAGQTKAARAHAAGPGPAQPVAVGHRRHGACSLRAGARDRRS